MWYVITGIAILFFLCLYAFYISIEKRFQTLNDRLSTLWPSIDEVEQRFVDKVNLLGLDRLTTLTESCDKLRESLTEFKVPEKGIKKVKKKGK